MEEEVVKLWESMITKQESSNGIEEYLKRISNKSFLDCEKEYEEEKRKPVWLSDQKFIFEEKEYSQDFLCLMEKIKTEFKWIYFFRPILYKYYNKFIQYIEKKELISKYEDFKLDMMSQIIQRLLNISYRVFVQENKILREEHMLKGKDSKEQYEFFCDSLLKNPEYLQMIYLSYCELTRVMCIMCRNTIDYIGEILSHIEEEYTNLEQCFGMGTELGKLEKITLGQGDSHNDAKTVATLYFTKRKLVYKCRDLGIEEKYQKLIMWMKKSIPDMKDIYVYKIYNCKKFGFVEFIENTPCSDETEVKEFYENMGRLLCILYTLNARDIHCENIIARKNSPVVVDLETIIEADINSIDCSTYEHALKVLNDSVVGIAILPSTLVNDKTGEAMEIGAMGSAKQQYSPFLSRKNISLDREEIHEQFENKKIPFSSNYPLLDGRRIGCQGFDKNVIEGFILIYDWIVTNRDLYYNKIYELFHHEHARLLCKSTKSYVQLLEISFHPDLLYNRIDREIYLHRIGLLIDDLKKFKLQKLYRHEIDSLMQGDIPIWYTYVDDIDIMDCNDNLLGETCQEAAIVTVKRKIYNMCEMDKKRQIALINESFDNCGIEINLQGFTGIEFKKLENELKKEEGQSDFSKNLLSLTLSRGIEYGTKQKNLVWFDSLPLSDNYYQVGLMELDLYSGNSGTALSMLYGGYIYSDNKFIDGAMKAVNPVITSLKEVLGKEDVLPCGVFTGITSELYALYKFKKNKETVDRYDWDSLLCRGLERIDEQIQYQESADLLSGVAGVLGFAVTLSEDICSELRDRSIKLAHKAYQKLISMCQKTDEDEITWKNGDDIGYAHGNSGIIVQLSRYYLITKDDEVMHYIERALAFERGKYKKDGGYKFRKNSRFYSWCNGLSGLLFAKLFLYKNFGEVIVSREEIEHMIKLVKKGGFGEDDCICHGDVGNINILLYASEVLEDKELEQACFNVKNGIRKEYEAKRMNNYELKENWGLMIGVTGIALGLMDDIHYLIDLLLIR